MITGSVRNDEPWIRLTLVGANGLRRQVDAVVDTGFTGSITLPAWVISELVLPFHSMDVAQLADGSRCTYRSFTGRILWDGKVRRIVIGEADSDPLVGMALMRGFELKIQVRPRGKVAIKRLPRKGKV